jgi:superoxide dismutase, Cu-Zn family
MQKFLPLLLVPIMAGCAGMTPSAGKTVSEVISADLARADGSWAGVATISKRSDGIFLSLEGLSECICMPLVNVKHLISRVLAATGTRP